jgi:isopenicillin-N epimerase
VVDGAHAAGQILLQLEKIGADFYGGNLHKWLCAPKGAGFLQARPEAQKLLKPLVVSWGYEAEVPGPSPFVDQHEWWGTRDIAMFLAVPEAIRFQEEHNWELVRAGCRMLLGETVGRICELTGMTPLAGLYAHDQKWFESLKLQMAAVPLPDETDLAKLKTDLYEKYRIEVPLILWNGKKFIRVSIQGYNTRWDADRLIEALKALL